MFIVNFSRSLTSLPYFGFPCSLLWQGSVIIDGDVKGLWFYRTVKEETDRGNCTCLDFGLGSGS